METLSNLQATLPAPVDYETHYWATKLGVPVEKISRLTSGTAAVEPIVLLAAA